MDQVRDVDFSEGLPYILASGGDDCKVKLWDYRTVAQPLAELENHQHWYLKRRIVVALSKHSHYK